MIVGYYIRGGAGGAWALVEQDERYNERVVVDGLTSEEATALYWRKMAEPHPPTAAAVPGREPQRQPPQLSLKL